MIPYTLRIGTKKRRKTISLRVEPTGEVVVIAPH